MRDNAIQYEKEFKTEESVFKAVSKLIQCTEGINSPISQDVEVKGKKYDVTIIISEME